MSTGDDGPVIASGAPFGRQPDGGVPLRQEIRDLSNNKKLWTLFLLGLKGLQDVNEDAPLSYYQIAGIHGAPHQKWPNRDWNGMQPDPGSEFGGFCTHNSILFLPWHRPYLALFEQALYQHVLVAANALSKELNDSSWNAVAKNFRLPYWDWADPRKGTYPSQALTENVSIIQPGTNGQEQPMANPLYRYKFSNPDEDGNVNNAGETWRLSDQAQDTAVAQALVRRFKQSFQQQAQNFRERNLTERVLYILQSYRRYGPFSNDAFRGTGRPGTYGSLEGIHNTIHSVTGGAGQMANPDVAAFDPIFWLHHCNIDRIFAIWQDLHGSDSDSSTYVEPENANEGDFNTPPGGTEDAKTDLMPFWKDENTFFNSNDVKQTQTFGYAYPETQSWKFQDQASYRDDIQARLVQLYPAASLANTIREQNLAATASVQPSAPILQKRAAAHVEAASVQLKAAAPVAAAAPAKQGSTKGLVASHHVATAAANAVRHAPTSNGVSHAAVPANRKAEDLTPHGKYLEWITNVKASKHEFGATFNVHIFLGPVPEGDSIFYPLAEGHVGTYSVFTRSGQTGCARCKQQKRNHLEVTGQIPLTVALVERYLAGQLDNLRPEAVVPYLQKNLHWRITYANGTLIDREQTHGVLVSVISNEVTLPASPEQLPIYAEDVHVYPEITTLPDGVSPRGSGTGLTDVAQA